MKKIFLLVLIISTGLSDSFAQSTDSIEMVKVFGGYRFYQKEKRLSMRELVQIMQPNEQASKYIHSAQSNTTLATIIGAIGGALIGWPVGTALGGGDPNWTLAGVGAGLVVVSIPFSSKANKQAKLAVGEFNSAYRKSSFLKKLQFNFGISGNSIGIRAHF